MRVIAVSLGVVAIAACAGPIELGHGRVSGMVGGWPAHPQGGDIAPAPNKVVLFLPESGGASQSATSGSDGHYFIDLTPGQYEVRLSGFQPAGLLYGRDPKTYGQWPRVTVADGTEVKLDLIYDTGIR